MLRIQIHLILYSFIVISIGIAFSTPNKKNVLHEWDFTKDAWKENLLISSDPKLQITSTNDPEFDLHSDYILKGNNGLTLEAINPKDLPAESISVEAVLSIRNGQQWGSIVAYAQDNGSYERGWLLGYNERSFVFWVSTGKSLIQATSSINFEVGRKYHVVGTYDGESVKIFVNGKLSGVTPTSGNIAYPDKAYYTLGIYKDDDESYPMTGTLKSVRIYDNALSSSAIIEHTRNFNLLPFSFNVEPALRYLSNDKVRIDWAVDSFKEMKLYYGRTRNLESVVSVTSKNRFFSAEIPNIEPDSIYYYKISDQNGRGSSTYEFNTNLNFTVPLFSSESNQSSQIDSLINSLKIKSGFCLIIGSVELGLIESLVSKTKFSIIVLESNEDKLTRLRKSLYAIGVYGSRVTVMSGDEDSDSIPLSSCMVNLLISEKRNHDDEINRVLAPGRSVSINLTSNIPPYYRPKLKDSGDWTHQYGDIGNSASSTESLSGATGTQDFVLQWVGRPGADFGIDRNPRMPAPLSANGRLFHQGMNRLVSMDAHNGSILWSLEAPALRRVNIPRDCGNWCADSDYLYVAIKNSSWMLNAENGDRSHVFNIPKFKNNSAEYEWGFIGRIGNTLVGSAVRGESSYKNFWSGKMWYDGKAGEMGTEQVCSEAIFGFPNVTEDNKISENSWVYSNGIILNPTISGSDNNVYFVESRNDKIKALKTGRIGAKEIWDDQFLVCLNATTGDIVWENKINTEDGTITFYLQSTEDRLVLTSSNTKFHIYTYDAKTGDEVWSKSVEWPDDHHSGHMQHPVISGNTIYLQPNGHNIETGNVVTNNMGKREGCHNYVGAGDALIYRGTSRQISMWSKETESVTSWPRLRPSCWLNTIPSSGMLLIPEGGGGCSCGGWMETSLGFIPRVHLERK